MFQDFFCAGTWCEKRCADNQLFLAGTQGETLPLDTIVQQMLVNLRNLISEERMMRFLQNGGAHMSWDLACRHTGRKTADRASMKAANHSLSSKPLPTDQKRWVQLTQGGEAAAT